jgi:hypothetical protein
MTWPWLRRSSVGSADRRAAGAVFGRLARRSRAVAIAMTFMGFMVVDTLATGSSPLAIRDRNTRTVISKKSALRSDGHDNCAEKRGSGDDDEKGTLDAHVGRAACCLGHSASHLTFGAGQAVLQGTSVRLSTCP